MTAPILDHLQRDFVAGIRAEIDAGHRSLLAVAPTAFGKTVVFSAIIRVVVQRGQRVVVLVHRRELTQQTSRKLADVGVDHGIVQAGFPAHPDVLVQVCSIQTLHARAIRRSRIELPPADFVFVDEAHHVLAASYREILRLYPNAIIIGFTATPCRGDGGGLGDVFDALVLSASVVELIVEGRLVGSKFYAPDRPDLKGVRVQRADYVESDLAKRMDVPKLVGDIVDHWHRLGKPRRTVVFATLVAHSIHIRDEFRLSGVRAEHIDGSTPLEERDAILAQLAAGEIDVVCNCMVLTEGWDRPEVSCLVLARPTKSLGLYLQMVGRVLRAFPGKTGALILDHSGAVFEHGFPEDEIEWTLEKGRLARNKTKTAGGESYERILTTCPECHAVRMEGKPCPACGWRPTPKPRNVEIVDGDLGHVHRDGGVVVPYRDKLDFQRQLAGIARDRGYRDGWVAHKYREKFGVWPKNKTVDPRPPEPGTLLWVRSRAIAYAKSQRPA